ncbi:MAG: carbon storage regulator [Planctomycetota bacterium]|nr:carbon storage regulator [Planctomycetota bacterium]
MLVLTRKSQDSVRIGDNITVTILRIKGNTVRIGVEAPDDVRIVRGELPRFEVPAETPTGNEGPPRRQPSVERPGKVSAVSESTGQTTEHRDSVNRLPTESLQSRQKPYVQSHMSDAGRTHPMNSERLPNSISSTGTNLPLPPR